MKYPSDFLSAEPTTSRKENWLNIKLNDKEKVAIVGKTIGMYTITAMLPPAWNSYLMGFLVIQMAR